MKTPYIIAPIQNAEDIQILTNRFYHKNFYIDYSVLNPKKSLLADKFFYFVKECNCKLYVNFPQNITCENTEEIEKILISLARTNINGIFTNVFFILNIIKKLNLPLKTYLGRDFDIHNSETVNFLQNCSKASGIIMSEEFQTKNLQAIKNSSDLEIGIHSNCLDILDKDIVNSGVLDFIFINNLQDTEKTIKEIEHIDNIINGTLLKNEEVFYNKKSKAPYKTNHYIGKIITPDGKILDFSKNVKNFRFPKITGECTLKTNIKHLQNLAKINLKLNSLSQIDTYEKFIKKYEFNPVNSIEFGEITNPKDLCKTEAGNILEKVSSFCRSHNIEFKYGTPKTLIERDFERVFEDTKACCKKISPNSIVINNLGFLHKFIQDKELSSFPIELGCGIKISNGFDLSFLLKSKQIIGTDLGQAENIYVIKEILAKIDDKNFNKRITICGSMPILSQGLCPLSKLAPDKSRLNCKALCQKGQYAIFDSFSNSVYPFISDGFCQMHLFKDEFLNLNEYTKSFQEIGINEFTIDMSILDEEYLSVLLIDFLNKYEKSNKNLNKLSKDIK